MKSLLDYIKHKDGTYVAIDLTPESKDQLDNYLKMTLDPIDRVDPSSYHVTIIYSRTPVPKADQFKDTEYKHIAKPVKYEVFPTKSDGKCLVLRLDFPFAESLNAQLTKLGATSDYAEYKAHVTIAYDTQIDIDPETLSVPPFDLIFSGVKVSPLETDYVPPQRKSGNNE